MLIHITARRVQVDDALMSYLDRRLAFALDHWEDLAGKRVDVRIVDVNGSRGGRDKFCRILLETDDQGPLIVDATEETVEWAISTAVDRLAKRLRRSRNRVRSLKRRARNEPLGYWT